MQVYLGLSLSLPSLCSLSCQSHLITWQTYHVYFSHTQVCISNPDFAPNLQSSIPKDLRMTFPEWFTDIFHSSSTASYWKHTLLLLHVLYFCQWNSFPYGQPSSKLPQVFGFSLSPVAHVHPVGKFCNFNTFISYLCLLPFPTTQG